MLFHPLLDDERSDLRHHVGAIRIGHSGTDSAPIRTSRDGCDEDAGLPTGRQAHRNPILCSGRYDVQDGTHDEHDRTDNSRHDDPC